MTRFTRLEFEPVSQPDVLPQPASAPSESATPSVRKITPDPDHDDRHWLKEADNERRNGQFENALRRYSRALEWDKSAVGGWVGQVQMLVMLGEHPEAETWARKALELFKNNAELLAGQAQALCRIGDVAAALGVCDLSLKQTGSRAYPWMVRGEVMLARREKNADHCFDKAVQINGDWLLQLEIGEICCHHGQPAKAMSRLHRAVELAPDQAYAWFCQGRCEAILGLIGPARKSLQRCQQLAPGHTEARRALAELENVGGMKKLIRKVFPWSR